ncbi:hypothetical protein Tco_0816906, partial [Tanacetum coccineum]
MYQGTRAEAPDIVSMTRKMVFKVDLFWSDKAGPGLLPDPVMFDDEPGNGSPGEELCLLVELLRFLEFRSGSGSWSKLVSVLVHVGLRLWLAIGILALRVPLDS